MNIVYYRDDAFLSLNQSVSKNKVKDAEQKKCQDDGAQDCDSFHPNLQKYLRDISKYKLLSKEKTEQLALLCSEEGDKDAATSLILANLRLVVKIVMDFQYCYASNFLDLIQEGNVGLSRAVEKYDPHRGVKFSSYAAYWIRAHILKHIMDNWRLVKIGTTQAQRKLFFKLNKEKKYLESQGINPRVEILAKRLEVSEKEVVDMDKRLGNSEVSLESPVKTDSVDDHKIFLAQEGPSVEDIVAHKNFNERLNSILKDQESSLSDRERVILKQRLLSDAPRTLNDIAVQFAISRERVRQIELNLVKKLKIVIEDNLVGLCAWQELV